MNIPTDYAGRPSVTNEMKRQCHGEFTVEKTIECPECAGAGCDACGLEGGVIDEVDIPWTTIKQIYKAMAMASQDS